MYLLRIYYVGVRVRSSEACEWRPTLAAVVATAPLSA